MQQRLDVRLVKGNLTFCDSFQALALRGCTSMPSVAAVRESDARHKP